MYWLLGLKIINYKVFKDIKKPGLRPVYGYLYKFINGRIQI